MTNNELYALLSDLAEELSEDTMRQTRIGTLRARISELVESHGGKVNIEGLARAEIRAPVIVEQFDKGALTELIQSLSESGHAEIASEIKACIKRTARTGGLVVVMERKAKA
jgi:hypothetical protein